MSLIYQLWLNGKFHRYLPASGNARQRRVTMRKFACKLARDGYDIFSFNYDTREKKLYRKSVKE